MRKTSHRKACNQCQARHLKCDASKPACTPCLRAGRNCVESIKYDFRYEKNPGVLRRSLRKKQSSGFENAQWIPIRSSLKFVNRDHTHYQNPSYEDSEDDASLDLTFHRAQSAQPEAVDLETEPTIDDPESQIESVSTTNTRRWPNFPSSSPLCSGCLLPLSAEDAFLLRYFISDLSIWFDYCDRDRHFVNVVVPAATRSSTLLNAILAVSSKHLSLNGKFDRYASDKYQQKCLQKLIPALNDQNVFLDETLFAATIILRLLDEMTESLEATQTQGYILGTHVLIRVRQDPTSESTLRAASLIIALRQEVSISFMTRRPVPPIVEYCHIDQSSEDPDDWTWALRMLAHCVDTLNYAYSGKPRDIETWTALNQYLQKWTEERPSTFTPIKYKDRANGQFFPEVWFMNDCHVAGNQYHGICRILLLAHDPNLPSLGLDRYTMSKQIDEQIRNEVRLLCGMALSNRSFAPAMFNAGMAIAMCGERFSNPIEQRHLLELLIETEAHMAWSSLKFQEALKNVWGME